MSKEGWCHPARRAEAQRAGTGGPEASPRQQRAPPRRKPPVIGRLQAWPHRAGNGRPEPREAGGSRVGLGAPSRHRDEAAPSHAAAGCLGTRAERLRGEAEAREPVCSTQAVARAAATRRRHRDGTRAARGQAAHRGLSAWRMGAARRRLAPRQLLGSERRRRFRKLQASPPARHSRPRTCGQSWPGFAGRAPRAAPAPTCARRKPSRNSGLPNVYR